MSETVIVALLSLLGSLGGTLGGILVSNKLTNFRLERLEKQVQAHNNLVERTYHIEGEMDVLHEQIKVANHRIGDLEHKEERR